MGTWNYFWHLIFSFFLCTKNITASKETTSTQTETNAKTEAAPMSRTQEGSSLKVSARSKAISLTFPTPSPSTTDTSMDTASDTAASWSLRPGSAAKTHSSFSSSSDGFTAATTTPQESSTSNNTEAGLAATSHPSMALVSFAPSSTPALTGIGSGTVSTNALTHGPAPSTPSSIPSASTSSMSAVSEITKASLSSTQTGSTKMHALQLTSTPVMQGQAMTEEEATSYTPESPLAAMATTSAASSATAPPGETLNKNWESGQTADHNTEMTHSLPATQLVTPSTLPMVGGEQRTETAPMTPTWEGSSPKVPAGSEVTSPTFPTPRPGTTDTSMDTARGTAASLFLRPSSAAMSHSSSSSSSPDGFTAATTTPQKSSTSGNIEAVLAAASHPSMALTSSASSSTPAVTGIGSGTASANALTHGPAPSTPSSMPLISTSSMSPAAETTESSLSFTVAGRVLAQAAQLTSIPPTQGQAMTEANAASSSPRTTLAAAATTSAANPDTALPSKVETPNMNKGSVLTTDPNTQTIRSLPSMLLVTPSMQLMMGGEARTETALTTPIREGSSPKVPAGSKATSPSFPTPRPGAIDTSMDTARGTAASLFLRPSSAAMSHSSSSSPDGFTAATTTPQKSSTSGNTEAVLAATSHPSMALTSSAPVTAGVEEEARSGTVSANALTHGPAPSMPSSMPLVSTSSMSPAAETTESSLSFTMAGSMEMQAAQLTSTPRTQGQTMTEGEDTSSSSESPLAAMATTSAASRVTAPPGKGKTPNTNTNNSPTADPSTMMTRFILASSLVNPSTLPMMGGEQRTETAPTTPTWEGSSLKVSVGSVSMSLTFPTPSPSSTAASVGTASDTTASQFLRPSSAATTHSSFSSSPDGFTAATTTPQKSSTRGTTDESLATTSHLSTALMSSAPSSTPAVTGNIQMTTVPPKSAMARFTGSTANPIFTTTFASGPCMPVSIKVQNVTRDAIQFSWTGGRSGSLYTISLMYGNQEINKTTTKETKTVFEHLLPGHVYTVSVAVLSCAEDSGTSVSVRTDPVSCFNGSEFCLPQNTACPDLKYIVCSHYQAFACSVFLKSQTFNHTLYDSDSEDYKTMSESIKTEVVREMRIKLKDDHFNIIVLGFRPGSVIADFIALLQTQDSIGVNVMQAHLSQILKSKFGDQTEVTTQSLSAQSSTEKSSTWKVAVIVLGVLLGVALVLIFLITLVYIYMKKRSGEYLVEPKGLLGNFVYKQL